MTVNIISTRTSCAQPRWPLRQWLSSRRQAKLHRAQLSRLIGLTRLGDLRVPSPPGICTATDPVQDYLPKQQVDLNAPPSNFIIPTATPEPKEVPSHWIDHLSHLRPGERRALKGYIPIVARVNSHEPAMQLLSDEELAALTPAFRSRLSGGEPLSSLLPEAFAAVREAAYRVLGMRHYDVQILGGIVLAEGQVAEMATGEGKTLVAALPAYLYALTGKGVHVVTVNDYLAQRDAAWIGKILQFMGLSVGVVTAEVNNEAQQQAFAADVTYVTAYQLAFSFLHDNLAPSTRAVSLRRPLHYAIVDEVDSILIDEARNPFIVTFPDHGADVDRTWRCAVSVARHLEGPPPGQQLDPNSDPGAIPSEPLDYDYIPDYRSRIATLTQRGMRRAVQYLASPGIYQIIIAVPIEEREHDEEDNTTSPSSISNHLHVVVLAPTTDSRLELTVYEAESGYPSGLSSHSSSLLSCSILENSASATLGERRVVVDSPEDIGLALEKLGLRALPANEVTEEQWGAAAPAALWTGGERAWGRYISQCVRAVHMYIKDIHYILKGGEIVIVDTATGRERSKSRWQSGLHQALEAKEESEGIRIRPEDTDKGRTTYQSLFNLYTKLSGMTGTAATEAEEFGEAYQMVVVRVPPHRPSRRRDNPPVVMMGREGWQKRVAQIVAKSAAQSRPVLLGTSSVEESEAVLEFVSQIPFRCELSRLDARRLERALGGLPRSLPPPNIPENKKLDELPKEQQAGVWGYLDLMENYEKALMIARRVQRSGQLSPEIGVEVEHAAHLLRAISRSGLLFEDEVVECIEVADVLHQVVNRSRLGGTFPINLLNARPDRARKEAEIIAQAGLPGTVTVATAMAGRGTDILLGGNPKGLTLIALKHYLLPIMASGADDLSEFITDPPLNGLPEGEGFKGEPDMKLHLPPALYRTYFQARDAVKEEAQKLKNSTSGAAAVPAAEHTAAKVSEQLGRVLESVEVDRSVFLLRTRRAGLVPSLESALEWADEQISTTWAEVTPTERSIRRYALLQWLWFDAQCEKYAAQVRAAGGLSTVITSIQDTRRTELQLRGRAGRQGDPGETYMISHREDPAVQTILSPAQAQGLWSVVEAQTGPDSELSRGITNVALKTLTTQAEQLGLSTREQTRRYDAAIDSYRRHVFRLRRILAGGGDAARAALAHRQLRRLAEELVLAHVDPNRSPREWKLEELLHAVQTLFRKEEFSFSAKEEEGTNAGGILGGNTNTHLSPLQVVTSADEVSRLFGGSEPGYELLFQIQLNTEGTADVLRAALCSNHVLPCPEYYSMGPGGDESGWMAVRRRVALREARRQEDLLSGDGSTKKKVSDEKLRGRYAVAAMRLQVWIGDLVTRLYERKRSAIIAAICRSPSLTYLPSYPGTHPTPIHAISILRLWERDVMLACLDALWSDFLQDVTTLQRAALTRAFSQLDPVDEFRLEASQVFARLLTDFRRQSAVSLLGPVDLRVVEWYYNGTALGDGEESRDRVREVLDDVAWLADWIEAKEESRDSSSSGLGDRSSTGSGGTEPGNGAVYNGNTTTTTNTIDNNIDIDNSGSGVSAAELALIDKLMGKLSQVSQEDLSAAMKKLDEQRRNGGV